MAVTRSTRLPRQRYLDHLARESARFAAALAAAPPQVPVPTCPEWSGADLAWHLTEVQWFWGTAVRDRVTEPGQAAALALERPPDGEAVRALLLRAGEELVAALAAGPVDVPVWTWADDDHTIGFVLRRQAHEALIHRVDAELVAGARTPMDADLSADGVDELLRIMAGPPPWAAFTPAAGCLRVRATDTGHSWRVTPGRFTGTDPASGQPVDEPGLLTAPPDGTAPPDDVAGEAAVDGALEGAAADLDCLLWNRPTTGPVRRRGDAATLAAFDAVIGRGQL